MVKIYFEFGKFSTNLDFFSKHRDFGPNIRISRFWSKFTKNLDWCQNFRNISILTKIQKNSDFGQNLGISWFCWIFSKYVDFVQNFRNDRLWTTFSKSPHLVKIFEKSRFRSNFRKISMFVNFSKNPDFDQNFRNFDFGKLSKKSDSGQNSRKF